jgi:hypothetical protein
VDVGLPQPLDLTVNAAVALGYAPDGTPSWVRTLRRQGTNNPPDLWRVISTGDGGVVAAFSAGGAGNADQTFELGDGMTVVEQLTLRSHDILLARFSATGALASRSVVRSRTERGVQELYDDGTHFLVVGRAGSSFVFDGGGGSPVGLPRDAAYVARFDPATGALGWVQQLGQSASAFPQRPSVQGGQIVVPVAASMTTVNRTTPVDVQMASGAFALGAFRFDAAGAFIDCAEVASTLVPFLRGGVALVLD